jgi:adenylate kinase family enzyme
MAGEVFFDERCCYIRRLVGWGHAHTLLKINAGHEKAQKAKGIMRKVLVIGSCGSGKSTVAAQLGDLLNLEVNHLDKFYWRAGWAKPEPDEWIEIVKDLIERDAWIIDGNYSGTLDLRLPKCDAVVFLDLPRVLCLWRIVKRFLVYRDRTRPDIAEGCLKKLTSSLLVGCGTTNVAPDRR